MTKPRNQPATPATEDKADAVAPGQPTESGAGPVPQSATTSDQPAADATAGEPAQADQPAADATEGEPAQAAPEEKPKLLTVTNRAKSSLRQPSSGWIIKSGESREMLNDGWLENQLNARLLVLA